MPEASVMLGLAALIISATTAMVGFITVRRKANGRDIHVVTSKTMSLEVRIMDVERALRECITERERLRQENDVLRSTFD